MRNPFYVPPEEPPDPEDKVELALAAATRYLRACAPHQEVDDDKVRAQHPAMKDPKVWAAVQKELAPVSAPPGKER